MTARLSTPRGGHLQPRKVGTSREAPISRWKTVGGVGEKVRLVPALPVWKDCSQVPNSNQVIEETQTWDVLVSLT